MAVLSLWARTSGTGEVRSRRTIASVGLPCNAANVTDDGVIPAFDALPRLPGSGVRHAWDVWGRGDNLGSLNRLTGPVVAAAASGVRTGGRIRAALPAGRPRPAVLRQEGVQAQLRADGAWRLGRLGGRVLPAVFDAMGRAAAHRVARRLVRRVAGPAVRRPG